MRLSKFRERITVREETGTRIRQSVCHSRFDPAASCVLALEVLEGVKQALSFFRKGRRETTSVCVLSDNQGRQ
jgi:hypothetical protein